MVLFNSSVCRTPALTFAGRRVAFYVSMRVFHSELTQAIRSMPDLRAAIRRGGHRQGASTTATLACRLLFALGEPGATLQKTADICFMSFRRARRLLNFAEGYFNAHAGDAKSAEGLVAGFMAAIPNPRRGRRAVAPERRAQVLLLAQIPGRSVRSIARETGLDPSTVCRMLAGTPRPPKAA